MKDKPLHREWLDRARSNLERARAGKVSRFIRYEDLCFDCQQCVEKSLKALFIFKKTDFQWTHHISVLLNDLESAGLEIPPEVKKSAVLSLYAVRTRYPGEEEPVRKKEFMEALALAEIVFEWVKGNLKK